ncbi:sigma 54-interacting transcriptional regulator [Sorangium sp. So ce131]|uniref:sigma 54-interacting transcriptional regulator n=1 Tax=Sorangium sp. So ce131 TaxID=3133282 RepID=UPI003F5FF9AC
MSTPDQPQDDESAATLPVSAAGSDQLDPERASKRHAVLLIYHRDGVETVRLRPGVTVVVGRESPADVAIPDKTLSRRHAQFTWLTADEIVVEDLGSLNGTFVAGRQVEKGARVCLRAADEVRLGTVPATVQVISAAEPLLLGLEGHDAMRSAVDLELRRAKFFGRSFAVLAVREEPRTDGHVARWCPRVRALLRSVDRIALYSGDAVEILLPEVDERKASEVAHALVEHRKGEPALVCGVALYPGTAASADELLGVAWEAARRARPERPVALVPLAEPRTVGTREEWAPTQGAAEVVAESPGMRALVDLARRPAAAPSGPTVLLHGETGTGKEVLAQFIHEASPRRRRPLVCVNCGALPSGLVEGILFGTVPGVHTSAVHRRGVFEDADGGTLFLDEIGELSVQAQVTLLRVLETRRVQRLGSTKEIQVDVRIIAATHQELDVMVAAGKFRRDLYFRLNTITLEIPPLRERKEDIAPLATRFLAAASKANQRVMRGIDDEALALLEKHSWPGNVRELKNAIERAVVVAETDLVTALDLPPEVRRRGSPPPAAPAAPGRSGGTMKERLQRAEREAIVDVLRETDGSQTEAARVLEMPLRTLQQKIKDYEIKKVYHAPGDPSSKG